MLPDRMGSIPRKKTPFRGRGDGGRPEDAMTLRAAAQVMSGGVTYIFGGWSALGQIIFAGLPARRLGPD